MIRYGSKTIELILNKFNMIPKTIHYCWFGCNPLPSTAKRCIESWRKFFPDYDIKEWNEDNFDVNIIPYTKEAYSVKKYAFVSDYARFWILYNYGGLYFDTDVEVIRNMDNIIANGPFMGFEQPREEVKRKKKGYGVAPGLGLGVNPGLGLYKELLDYYEDLHFLDDKGNPNPVTIVKHTTDVLISKGLMANNELQQVSGVWIYPWDVFCPQSYYTKQTHISKNSVSIHLYSDSWNTPFNKLKKFIIRHIGSTLTHVIVKIKGLFR